MKHTTINPLITNITSDSINSYFKDIKKFPLLTKEEEIEYLKMRNTDPELAVKKLMEGNLRLIISIAKLYQYSNIPLEDLIQIGNLGLYKAILAYDDPEYKVKLSDYITYKVRGEILNAITTEKRSIQIPRYRSEQIAKVSSFINKYVQENEFEPTVIDIADALELDDNSVKEILNIINFNITSETANPDSESDIFDSIANKEDDEEVDPDFLKIVKQNLNESEFQIISHYFGLGTKELNPDQIASLYNVSVDRVRFIINKAIKKLRHVQSLQNFI